MNKFMYLGLILGVIVSIILNKIYIYENPSMVSVICAVIGAFAGASLDNRHKKKFDK